MLLPIFLARKRQQAELSASGLAEECFAHARCRTLVRRAQVWFWEHGYQGRVPSLAQYIVLCEALGLSDAEILHGLQLAKADALARVREKEAAAEQSPLVPQSAPNSPPDDDDANGGAPPCSAVAVPAPNCPDVAADAQPLRVVG